MDDVIYPDVAGRMLVELNDSGVANGGRCFANREELACNWKYGLGLNNLDAFKRVLGQKGSSAYWPKTDYNIPEAVQRTLASIAQSYPGPGPFARRVLDYLGQSNVSLPDQEELERLARGLPQSWSGHAGDPFGGNEDAEHDFTRILDLVAERCVRQGRAAAASGEASGASSAFGALMHLVLGEGCLVGDGSGWQAALESDGQGPVCAGLPDDAAELAARLLPRALLDRLRGEGDLTAPQVAAALLEPSWNPRWQGAAAQYFVEDGGHRFTIKLVGGAQCVLSSYCDAELLLARIGRLYQALCAEDAHAGAWGSYRAIRRYSMQRDAPRMLAAASLSTLVGVERTDLLAQVLEGRR